MAYYFWSPDFVTKWTEKFEELEKKLTNEQLEYLRHYFLTINRCPRLDEIRIIAKQWNNDNQSFVFDLDDWFFGRVLADQFLERRRYLLQIAGA